MNVADRPHLSREQMLDVVRSRYGLCGETGGGVDVEPLPGERDQNVRITTPDGERYVLKVAHPDESPAALDLQDCALRHLAGGAQPDLFPTVVAPGDGAATPTITVGGRDHLVRLLTWCPGRPIADALTPPESPPAALLDDIGRRLGVMARELAEFAHAAMHRAHQWDSKHAFGTIRTAVGAVGDAGRADLVRRRAREIERRLVPRLARLPMQVIHNDVNDHNLLVNDAMRVCGVIDFGDMVHSYRVCELANAIAYLMLERDDPASVAAGVVEGFHAVNPLTHDERLALPDLVDLRLCLSVSLAARQRRQDPSNAYLGVTEGPAWAWLEADDDARLRPPEAIAPGAVRSRPPDALVEARHAHLSRALSTSYRQPLKIVRGRGVFLFDDSGRRYLDCVNNVCHVGHCHPRVVEAARAQMTRLNTNTRYLHDNIAEYAERLTTLLPAPLSVCFFVNSGSEANDLALRLARTHTDASDTIVVDHAYHGHTQSLIDVSPYKYDGKAGHGAPATTHKVAAPDRYRGPFGYDDHEAGARYAGSVADALAAIARDDRRPAGFIAESFLGVAGQIELPPGYLARAYDTIRAAGGVSIADEVQIGFGRVGSHFWGFETQGVVPDIVTLGKPMGNGHPLAAVVTTPEIARSFETGMEYFNTFGGNPVSCAIGLAVLDVIESEQLQRNAREVGAHLLERLRDLARTHELIGDVRGRGLFAGIELVRDRATRAPATEAAAAVIEYAKDAGVLLSTDGPFSCVIKIKPPIVFSRDDVGTLVRALDDALAAALEP